MRARQSLRSAHAQSKGSFFEVTVLRRLAPRQVATAASILMWEALRQWSSAEAEGAAGRRSASFPEASA
eukprot:953740-Prymnesium_polylepis.1